MMPIHRHVAILGGGAAGLTAAFFLHNQPAADGSAIFRCTVFDTSPRLGGNVFSAYLGQRPYESPFVDLGVNDFNTARYHNFMAVLGELGRLGYPVRHAPLIDTTTYYTPRGVTKGAQIYTEADLVRPETQFLQNIARDWDRFQDVAHQVLHDPRYARMSVDEFIAEQRYSYDFAEYNLRARINGMYYSNGRAPGEMPIRAVMSYYHLQEGLGERRKLAALAGRLAAAEDDPSPRHYFVNGASDWLRQLTRCLTDRGVELRLGARPTAYLSETGAWRVLSDATPVDAHDHFDDVICAMPAEDVPRSVALGLPPRMDTLLAQFEYLDSMAIVHDDESMLPADRSRWSTYNILVYPPGTRSLRPYTITYVDRKHQGEDSNAPPYLTLTPFGAVDAEGIPPMFDLPGGTRAPAVAYLRHNTLSLDAMDAQAQLPRLQGQNRLWFTGGWANGAGLHEEIVALSKEIAMRVRGSFLPEHGETRRADEPSYVPRHLRESFGSAPRPWPDGFVR